MKTFKKLVTILAVMLLLCSMLTIGVVAADPAADSELTIAEANALGLSKSHNVFTEGKYYVTGVITEVYNTTYGNMYITDEEGNTLHIYGTWNANGTIRYDKLSTKPVAGDTITAYGILGQYDGAAEMKNAWLTTSPEADRDPNAPELDRDPANPQEYVFADFNNGEQYALQEVHRLDNAVTVTTNDAFFTSELRLYGFTGTDAYAIIHSARPISAMVLKMGYTNNSPLNVRVSNDGASFSHYQTIKTLTSAYRDDYTVTFDEATNYIQLDPGSANQIRIKSITLYFDGEIPPEKGPCTEHIYSTKYDLACDYCWEVRTADEANHPADGSHLNLTDAHAIGEGMDEGTFSPNRYYVTGVVTKAILSGGHKNITICDTNGNTFYSSSVSGNLPQVGDTVTIYGYIQNYAGTAQVYQGSIQNSRCEYDHAFDTDCNICGTLRKVTTPTFAGNSISEDVSGLAFCFNMEIDGIAIKKGTYVQADFTNATYEDYQLLRVGAFATNTSQTIEIEGKRLYDLEGNMASFAYRIMHIPADQYDTTITMTPYFVVLIDGEEVTIYGETQAASYNAALTE